MRKIKTAAAIAGVGALAALSFAALPAHAATVTAIPGGCGTDGQHYVRVTAQHDGAFQLVIKGEPVGSFTDYVDQGFPISTGSARVDLLAEEGSGASTSVYIEKVCGVDPKPTAEPTTDPTPTPTTTQEPTPTTEPTQTPTSAPTAAPSSPAASTPAPAAPTPSKAVTSAPSASKSPAKKPATKTPTTTTTTKTSSPTKPAPKASSGGLAKTGV